MRLSFKNEVSIYLRFLCEATTVIALPLTLIFNKSLQGAVLPENWKDAVITPLFKKRERCLAEKCRPLSLTLTICKLMEAVLKDQIVRKLESDTMQSDVQHGFVKSRSHMTNLLMVLEEWTSILDSGGGVDVIYLDYRKAFDKVPHTQLISKLRAVGLSESIVLWVKAYLTSRRMKVTVSECESDWASV
jgi:Reverse transcriptase (RNA-dependent DNA polymerase)